MDRVAFPSCMLVFAVATLLSLKHVLQQNVFIDQKENKLDDGSRSRKANREILTGHKTTGSSNSVSRVLASHPAHNGVGYVRSDKIYGQIHMAKTGGTSLNGMLANKFERVCGVKGYSYDAYQANERFKQKNRTTLELHNVRDRVPFGTIDEIGFEDCDFISNEIEYDFWFQFDDFHGIPMELHLPCRDPIDHIMSQLNFRGKRLSCRHTEAQLLESVKNGLVFVEERFSMELVNRTKKTKSRTTLKCYDFRQQFTTYIDYISDKLQPRRLESEYKQRETNAPRRKENECIWKRKDLMDRIESFLVENYDYYKFCKQCLGSKDDITRTAGPQDNK